MNKTVFLSVIIPVYNAARYLPQCIESLLSVGLEDMEIILVDDGSTDSSAELIRSYCNKHKNIRLLRQPNSGPSVARNNGLAHALGEYIAFIDADDYVDSTAFGHHISQLRSGGADIWASDFVRVADNGCVLDEVYQIKHTELPIRDNSYLPEFLAAKDCVWNVWRYIFRRGFIHENGLRFAEGYSIAEDLEFVVRALSTGPDMVFYHEPYYSYRVNYGASLTRVFSVEKLRQLVAMLQRGMKTLGEGKTDDLLKAKLAREYILNLSALYEVNAEARADALAELEKGLWLMEPAKGAYSYAAAAVRLVGIPVAAWLLYVMKRVKRLRRGMKTKFFDRGQR